MEAGKAKGVVGEVGEASPSVLVLWRAHGVFA